MITKAYHTPRSSTSMAGFPTASSCMGKTARSNARCSLNCVGPHIDTAYILPIAYNLDGTPYTWPHHSAAAVVPDNALSF